MDIPSDCAPSLYGDGPPPVADRTLIIKGHLIPLSALQPVRDNTTLCFDDPSQDHSIESNSHSINMLPIHFDTWGDLVGLLVEPSSKFQGYFERIGASKISPDCNKIEEILCWDAMQDGPPEGYRGAVFERLADKEIDTGNCIYKWTAHVYSVSII